MHNALNGNNGMTNYRDNSFIELTAHIVAAYVRKNPVPSSGLSGLITSIHASINTIGAADAEPAAPVQSPAVNPKKSVTPDFIICLEDGKKFKSMKRHLAGLGITPEEYRTKWNLPADYPMVAPNYSAARSALATRMGLGRKPVQKKPAPKKRAAASKAGRARG
jgi:predicted transcriptional regulator